MATYNFNDSEYAHNFQDRINEANQSALGEEANYNQARTQSEQAYQAQQEAMKNRASYSDILNQAQESQGVNEARQQYKSDVEAVNAIRSAMNTLPSSINANSNVVLTNAQKQAALGNQMNKYLNSYDYATREAEASGNILQQAQNAAFTAAEAGANEQQQNISNAMTAYNQEMANLQNAYNQLSNERQRVFNIYGQMYEDEYKHMQEQLELYAQQLQAETSRYVADQNAAAQRYASEAGLRLQRYMDQKAPSNKNTDFATWLNSEAALNSGDWAEGMTDADKRANLMALSTNYANAVNNANTNALSNIMGGSTYQDYLRWRNS